MATKTAPIKACVFNDIATAQFADGNADTELSVVGYSGNVIANHWYWGNLAFDLAGIKFAKKYTPILDTHDTQKRVGVALKQATDGAVTFDGKFLKNPAAQQIRQDMQDGFPMEASLYIHPTVTETVAEGESVEVNGHTVKGPGTVFRKAMVKEVSLCTFGADDKTSATAFDDDNKQIEYQFLETKQMSDKQPEMTLEKFQADHSELYSKVFEKGVADGEKKERDAFAAYREACPDLELAVKFWQEGDKTPTDAKIAYLEAKLAEKAETPEKPAEKPVDPAVQEFSDDAEPEGEPGEKKPKTFMEAVEQFAQKNKCSKAEAIDKCVDLYADLHEKMLTA